jgi:hypothetical protein
MIRGTWPKRIINRSGEGCGQLQQILERFGAFNILLPARHGTKAAAGLRSATALLHTGDHQKGHKTGWARMINSGLEARQATGHVSNGKR